jgi:hypothetical protein
MYATVGANILKETGLDHKISIDMLSTRPRPRNLGTDTDSTPERTVASAGTVYVAVELAVGLVCVGVTVTLSGFTPVALPSRYQPPTSVRFPYEFNMATLMPTLDLKDRKEPK